MLKQGMPFQAQRRSVPLSVRTLPSIELPSLGETTPDLVATLDVAGNIHYLNQAGRDLLGIADAEDITGLSLADIHAVSSRPLVLGDGIETARLDGVWRGEAAMVTRDGREIPVSEVIIAHSEPQGECKFLSTIIRDITPMKQAAMAVSESERFYRGIVETANVGIWIINSDNRVEFVNPRMAKLLGYRAEEMVGQPLAAFMDADSPAHPHRSAAPPHAEVPGCDAAPAHLFRLRRRDGAELRVNLSTSPLFDREERYTGVLGMVTSTEFGPVEGYANLN